MASDNKFIKSLVQNAKQGNNAAIDQLFQMNLGKIYAFVLRLTANQSIAEVITRETFIEAWKRIKTVRTDSPFIKWLNAIAVYKTLDALRSKKIPDKKEAKGLKELESRDELDKYILALPETERIVFVLGKIEGYTEEEVADLMGVKKDFVNTYIEIAQNKLYEMDSSLKSEDEMRLKISKVIPELQPSNEVKSGISKYIMDVKVREKEEQDKIAAKLKEQEPEPVEEEKEVREEKKEILQEEPVLLKKKFEFDPRKIKKYSIGSAVVLIIVAAIYFVTSISSSWDIIQMNGQPTADNKPLKQTDGITAKSTVDIDENSNMTVEISSIGRLTFGPSTIIKRSDKNNFLYLQKGQVKKLEGNATDLITIETELAKFDELFKGSGFNLTVDDYGSSELVVLSGRVTVSVKELTSYVPKGFGITVQKGKFAIPYPEGSTDELKNLFKNFASVNDPAIGSIIALVTPYESLSLWHLIQIVSQNNRFMVVDKLNEFVPMPPGLSKQLILSLNKDALEEWRKEIELKL